MYIYKQNKNNVYVRNKHSWNILHMHKKEAFFPFFFLLHMILYGVYMMIKWIVYNNKDYNL